MEWLLVLAAVAWYLGDRVMGLVTARAGVTLTGLAPEGLRIVGAIDRAARTFDVDLVITSAVRPEDADSMHSVGKAIDVRTSNLTVEQIAQLFYWFKTELGNEFIVLFETPSLPAVPEPLRNVATVNPAATGVHFHLGVRRT